MTIILIAAMTKNRVIGKANDLPWHLPEDLANFKRVTTGHPCIMGKSTFQSIFSRIGKPLPNRVNIVISSSMKPSEIPGVTVCQSVEEALETANSLDEEVFVIGGASIYKQTLQLADKLLISLVDEEVEGDVFFPVINLNEWNEVSSEQKNGFKYVQYERK